MAALPLLTILPIAALVALVVLSLLAPHTAESLAVPIAVVGAALGIPHGAVDHLVPRWSTTSADSRSYATTRATRLLAFVVAYAGVAGLAFTASLIIPSVTIVAFLVLSALHFGRGEVVTTAERAGRAVPGPREEWAATVAPGLVVVGLLLWARPDRTAELVRPMSSWLARVLPSSAPVGLLLVAVAVVVAIAVQLSRHRFLDAAELVLLTLAFAVAPPVAAFGVWFGLWHAVRHTGRLLDLARQPSASVPSSRDWWNAARRLLVAGSLPSLAALSAVAAMWLLRDLAGLHAEIGVLLALTFPHAAVVAALDRNEARSWALTG
ncbi:MAG: Brp/Blh family beta-carotene 15,15'-dioxygenase [Actinomycetota bacterium]|nr:Brp/Blh family beta-carotene 15,15'-dioxygenase [Actinomycetota bacterium]